MDTTNSMLILEGFGIGFGIIMLLIMAVSVWAWVRIIQKAGFSGWWILVGLVPFVNAIFFFIFAFSDWPNAKEQK